MSLRDLTILGCSSQQPTRMRNHGAYLLRWNGEGFLFDPGEGTQRQFIFVNIPPPTVTRIFISHFHGDHCLGLGSFLMRLNLDKVKHPIHCYYPASGKTYFDRLRYGTIYHSTINVVEHPVSKSGIVEQDDAFQIEAHFLDHGVDNIAWRIKEADTVKFHKDKVTAAGIRGNDMQTLLKEGSITLNGVTTHLDDVSWKREGDVFSYIVDTRPCKGAAQAARGAKLLMCESTYLHEHAALAVDHKHLTAREAAQIACDAGAQTLILTHFSARYRSLDPFEAEARALFPETYAADDFKVFPFPR